MEGEIDRGDREPGRRARLVAARRCCASPRSRRRARAGRSPRGRASSKEKVASMPSPMNLSTWPPRGRSEAVRDLEHLVEQVDDDRTRRGVADRREAADVGVPDDRAQLVDRTAHDRAGVDAPPGVLAEIGPEQSRGDDVAGVRLHRQRKPGQRRLQERRIVVAETALPVGRERIDDAGSLRAVARASPKTKR